MLISLYIYLDSTHTNCPTTTCEVFNFLYKETAGPNIFVINVLRLYIKYFMQMFLSIIT
jgi:hypothetical protein